MFVPNFSFTEEKEMKNTLPLKGLENLKNGTYDAHELFSLAQSYKQLKDFNKGIECYKARIVAGGWEEEVWYSKLMIGESYEEMENWDQALHWYLDAYQTNPERAEPLQKIASYYRKEGQSHLAYLFAKQGLRIPFPENQKLFVSHPVYDYQFDEELSIAAYYTPYREEGFEAAHRLILNRNVPAAIKSQTYRNILFYVQNIKNTGIKPIEFQLPPLYPGSTEYFYPTNATIQKTKDGYDVICRTVNYAQQGAIGFWSRNPQDKTIRTRNFFLHYDANFTLLSQKEIIEDLPRKKQDWTNRVTGLEDCRLTTLDNNHWLLAATYDTHPTIGQSLCKLADKEASSKFIHIEKLFPLKGPDPYRCEKNWLPFVKDQELYVLYSCDPLTIYQVNQENGDCKLAVQNKSCHDFSHFRGSAAPIEFNGGYLLIVHEVVIDSQRDYLHRFVYLDKDFKVKKLSKPFTFFHRGVEYSCGMTIDHTGEKCIIMASFEEQKAYFIFVDIDTIHGLLEDLS